MQRMTQSYHNMESEHSKPAAIKTTLYELIEAVSEVVNPKEEQWVPLIVNHMLPTFKSNNGFNRDIS